MKKNSNESLLDSQLCFCAGVKQTQIAWIYFQIRIIQSEIRNQWEQEENAILERSASYFLCELLT